MAATFRVLKRLNCFTILWLDYMGARKQDRGCAVKIRETYALEASLSSDEECQKDTKVLGISKWLYKLSLYC